MAYFSEGVSSSRISRIHRTATGLASVILLLATVHAGASSTSSAAQEKSNSKPCVVPEIDFGGNDVQGLKAYGTALEELLKAEKFKELNCIADLHRSGKERFPGGMWKLHEFYWGITKLQGHPTHEDWEDRLKLAQRWVDATPESITARVVLAELYTGYAWDARGNDTSDSVTDSGWKLLSQRMEKAKTLLDQASALPAKCPEWYFAMQQVALGQGWDVARAEELLKRAVAFEPDYYYYYRQHAFYLMPQWNGEDGDASRFALQSADRIGGEAGDLLYFQIGAKIVCACDRPEFTRFSWPRLQKGYALLEKKYGVSVAQLNLVASMAVKFQDWAAADNAFQRIGDNCDKGTWMTETYFNQMKEVATQMGAQAARSNAILQEAATNLQSAGGAQYQKSVEQALLPFMRQCASSNNDRVQFELVVKVGKDGGAEDAWFRQPTAMAQCMMRAIYDSRVKKETPFPVPPRLDYWLDLHLDPASVSVAAAN